jgi:uncharacterized membrane protein (UPF0127 family)
MDDVTVARILPAALPGRFARARRAGARTDDAAFELVIAEGFLLRLRGLAGLDAGDIVPLLFPRTRSLHTFGMRAPIDVVWLELKAAGSRVTFVNEGVEPGGFVRAPRGSDRGRTAALELLGGEATALGLTQGDSLTLARPPVPSPSP